MDVENVHPNGNVRNAISSEEASLDGSLNGDNEKTLSDSELKSLKRANELAHQLKSPSSNEIEKECTKQRLANSKTDSTDQTSHEDNSDDWLDVLGNGDLMKKVLREGNGTRPQEGEFVKIVWKILDDEGQDEQEIQFILGYGFHADALDLAVPLMSVGEIAHIKSNSRFVDDSSDKDFYEYEIELLDVQPADSVDLNIRVNDAREWGNINFNKGKYEKAYRLYEYGIKLLSNADPDENADENELRIYTLISNSAACLLKLKEWENVVKITKDLPLSLNVDKLILTKLALRRSDALMQLKRYDEAMDSLKSCLTIDPSNTRARSLFEQIKNLNAKEEKRMDKLYKNMFKALGTDEPARGPIRRVKSFMLSKKFLMIGLLIGFVAIIIHLFRVYF